MRKLYTILSVVVLASMVFAACGTPLATEAPAAEEPVAEAPVAEEPAAEEPAATGPVSTDPTTFIDASSEVGIDTLDPGEC